MRFLPNASMDRTSAPGAGRPGRQRYMSQAPAVATAATASCMTTSAQYPAPDHAEPTPAAAPAATADISIQARTPKRMCLLSRAWCCTAMPLTRNAPERVRAIQASLGSP